MIAPAFGTTEQRTTRSKRQRPRVFRNAASVSPRVGSLRVATISASLARASLVKELLLSIRRKRAGMVGCVRVRVAGSPQVVLVLVLVLVLVHEQGNASDRTRS